MRFYPVAASCAAAALILGVVGRAHAVLGGAPAHAMQTSRGLFSVSERVTDSSVAIREYANAAGVVFAVSWQGPTRPDLKELLGEHFRAYAKAVGARPSELRRLDVDISQNGMLIQMGARLRTHRGRIVLTALLPQGVSIVEIR